MKWLTPGRQSMSIHGRRIRAMEFEPRSTVPIRAACVVANGMRAALAQTLDVPVSVRLSEPVAPDPLAWNAVSDGARVYSSRGSRAEGAIVLRTADAVAIVQGAFGETGGAVRSLSTIESSVLERIVALLMPSLVPLTGPSAGPHFKLDAVTDFTTYFEVLVEQPVRARIGVALSQESQVEPASLVRLEDLMDVEVQLAVQTQRASVPAGALPALEIGAIVPIAAAGKVPGTAYLAGSILCDGECGVRDGRYAFAAGPSATVEGSIAPSL